MDSTTLFLAIVDAVRVVGFPIVIAIILILMLWWVMRNAVGYFTEKLDAMSQRQEQAISGLTAAVSAQTVQAAQTHEALQTVMLFISSNMAQIVAHRQAVEPEVIETAPAPPPPKPKSPRA